MTKEKRLAKRVQRLQQRIAKTQKQIEKERTTKRKKLKTLAITSLWICLGVFVCYVLLLSSNAIWHFCPALSTTLTGQIGDFVGGVCGTLLTLAGTLYIIKTFRSQSKHNRKEVFETALMEMLELHKQNVSEIKCKNANGDEFIGRAAFPEFFKELQIIYTSTYEAIRKFLGSHNDSKYDSFRNENALMTLSHQLSYGFFFYNIKDYLLTRNQQSPTYDITLFVVQELDKDARMNNYKDLSRNILLGHYFRHLFNMVKYVDEANGFFNFKERETFCNLIRSQLSDYEQIVLYYNTLSPLGEAWIKPLGETNIDKMSFIGKYRLVKNCPCYFYYFGKKPGDVFAIEDQKWRSEGDKFFETDLREFE